MSNYVKSVNFAAKDALTTGDPAKVAKGTEVDTEFNNIATAVISKEDSANKNIANGYCGLDAGGIVPDARIAATVPRLATTNIFTATVGGASSAMTIRGSTPGFVFDESDGGTDQRYWRFYANGATYHGEIMNTAGDATTDWMRISRSAMTVTQIELLSSAIKWNGNTLFTTANDGSGSGLDSDLLDGQHGSFYQNAANLTSGSIPDARVVLSNISQWETGLAFAASQVTSGTFANARISSGNVTQHEGLLSISGGQISSAVASAISSTTQAAGTSSLAIATTAFACPGFSHGTSMYDKLPSGAIIQGGTSVITGTTSVNFPIPFPTACRSVVVTNNGTDQIYVSARSASAFTATNGNGTVNWIAFGY